MERKKERTKEKNNEMAGRKEGREGEGRERKGREGKGRERGRIEPWQGWKGRPRIENGKRKEKSINFPETRVQIWLSETKRQRSLCLVSLRLGVTWF